MDSDLLPIVKLLAADSPLPARHRVHPLVNNWKDHRDCHIKPDLILIYRKPDPNTLELVRLGSHYELKADLKQCHFASYLKPLILLDQTRLEIANLL